MKTLTSTLLSLATLILVNSSFGSKLHHYWPWGPLTKEDALPKIDLNPLHWLEIKKDPKTDMLTRAKAVAIDQKTELILTRNENGFVGRVLSGKKTLMQPKHCTKFTPFFENMHYCGLINDDEKIDFMLHFYCGGNGINADLNEVCLLLSNQDGYEATSMVTYGGGPGNHYIKIQERPHFIIKSFGGIAECLDGKTHNFWTYNLLEIKGDALYLANQNHNNFPRTIWFVYEPKHRETNLLSSEDKTRLHIQSLKEVSFIGNRVVSCPEHKP